MSPPLTQRIDSLRCQSSQAIEGTLAVGERLPTIYGFREHVDAGGLMSYGANYPDQFRRAADYVDKILRAAKPADIPVEPPTKFDLIHRRKHISVMPLTSQSRRQS